MKSSFLGLVALAALMVPAEATAIASVHDAFWQTDFAYYADAGSPVAALPAGVELSCVGTAVSDGLGGCRDSVTAIAVSNDGSLVTRIVDHAGALVLRNTSGVPLDGVFFLTSKFGAFYPAGPGTGARVDNAALEWADYFAVVSGAGGFDLRGCNMASGPGHSGRHVCRPPAPNMFTTEIAFGPLADGNSIVADWRIYVQVDARGDDPVPEPPALAVLLTGIAVLTACRRKAR